MQVKGKYNSKTKLCKVQDTRVQEYKIINTHNYYAQGVQSTRAQVYNSTRVRENNSSSKVKFVKCYKVLKYKYESVQYNCSTRVQNTIGKEYKYTKVEVYKKQRPQE